MNHSCRLEVRRVVVTFSDNYFTVTVLLYHEILFIHIVYIFLYKKKSDVYFWFDFCLILNRFRVNFAGERISASRSL